jgi:hypothetical protein
MEVIITFVGGILIGLWIGHEEVKNIKMGIKWRDDLINFYVKYTEKLSKETSENSKRWKKKYRIS